jgi:hypothetical protein
MESVESPKVDAEKIIGYIFKLASASEISKGERVASIVSQLENLADSLDFPRAFDEINPERFSSRTRQLPDYAKKTLSDAIELYVMRYSSK